MVREGEKVSIQDLLPKHLWPKLDPEIPSKSPTWMITIQVLGKLLFPTQTQ